MWTFAVVFLISAQGLNLSGTSVYTGFATRLDCEAFAAGMLAGATENPGVEATYWECTEEPPA